MKNLLVIIVYLCISCYFSICFLVSDEILYLTPLCQSIIIYSLKFIYNINKYFEVYGKLICLLMGIISNRFLWEKKMKLDSEIKGFIEKYKVNIWGTQDESLDMEDKELEDGMYCLGTSMGDDLVAHDEETIEVKDAWIMKNESLYESLRFVIDKFFTTENIEDWMDTDDGDIIETLSFRGENIEGKLYIIFDFELRGVSLSEIEEQLADEEFNEFLRVPPWADDEG